MQPRSGASVGGRQASGHWIVPLRRAAVALAACGVLGLVVGGGLARLAMRLVLVADERARGFDTAVGAVVGEVTVGGTVAVLIAGLGLGLVLGAGYLASRPFLPASLSARVTVFVTGATALGTAFVSATGRDDFAFVHEGASVALIVAALALTALPVPLLVDRLMPSARGRVPSRVAVPVVAVALGASVVLAVVVVRDALDVMRVVG